MRNMSDIIEQYLKQLIEESGGEVVEIKRAHIAEKFDCVPSQLNYVIKTRFTNEHGYTVERARGAAADTSGSPRSRPIPSQSIWHASSS